MNLLRRLASLPVLRAVLLQPRVRRALAGILALRFLRAAFLTTSPLRFVVAELVTRRGEITTWPLRDGGTITLTHRRDLEAFHELMVGGEYEPPPELRARTSAPRRILDVGGNIGMFAHWASRRWPDAQITSFEPDPANVEVFRAGLTDGGRIDLVAGAAMTQTGHAVLGAGEGAGRQVELADHPVPGSVPAIDIFEHLVDADLVKVDIEGGEWPILRDPRMSGLGPTTWVIEFHRVGAPSLPAVDAARDLFTAAGFTVGPARLNYWGHGTLWAWKD